MFECKGDYAAAIERMRRASADGAARSDVDDLLRRGPGLMMCHFAGREGAREGGREGTTCQINHVILCVMPLHFSLVVVVV